MGLGGGGGAGLRCGGCGDPLLPQSPQFPQGSVAHNDGCYRVYGNKVFLKSPFSAKVSNMKQEILSRKFFLRSPESAKGSNNISRVVPIQKRHFLPNAFGRLLVPPSKQK